MNQHHEPNETQEKQDSLWRITASPSIWAFHFLACYITAAVWCAKFANSAGSLTPVRIAIAIYTLAALAAIAIIGRSGYRRHSLEGMELPHDDDTPEDRHRFLGFATLLLSILSGIAVLFSAARRGVYSEL